MISTFELKTTFIKVEVTKKLAKIKKKFFARITLATCAMSFYHL